MQMAECTRPLQYAAASVLFSLDALGEKLESAWGRQVFGTRKRLSPPEEQHVTFANRDLTVKQPATYKLDPEGIARLDVEPVNRAHWVETWLAMEPLYERIESIILTKPHLNEPEKLSGLDRFFKGPGPSWEEFGRRESVGTIYTFVAAWMRQW
jgi:hypothetical protein